MAWKSFSVFRFTTWSLFTTLLVHGQTISTDTSVPPLQWINLTGLLQGSSSPPPLKNAAIGYDESRNVSRSVIIFGGESASGLAQSQTFLLNLETLTWSVPTPPNNLQETPAARSAAIAGIDSAPSNRQGFIVIGGKGSDGKGLTDVWEYDFNNKFWSQVNIPSGGPLPRWGASGGIDLATPPIQDPVVPGPNNTFYLAGGFDGTRPNSFSDVWRLNISGTLSSNLPNDSSGSWDRLTIGNIPPKFNGTGTVIGHQVVFTGGCTSGSLPSGECAEQDSYVIDTERLSETTSSICPAPRTNPVLVRNANSLTSTFASQVYLLLGTLDRTRWNDDDGLEKGEVAILDIQTGTWSRILPSGDPGDSGKLTFPSPREGAAAFSYPSALVGRSRSIASDTLIFGGQDSAGNLLSEIWLLRAYNGILSPSQPTWSGFGNGRLQTGINANGAGVNVTYMTKCASQIATSSPTTTIPTVTPSASTPPSGNPSNATPSTVFEFNSSAVHKILAPVSLAIFQAAFLFFRFVSPLYQTGVSTLRTIYASAVLSVFVYGSGIAGFVIAFTSISSQSSGSKHLRTGHGIAGVVFFALLYLILPGLLLSHACSTRRRAPLQQSETEKSNPARSPSPPEGFETYDWPSSSAPQSIHQTPSSPTPRQRTNSWGPSSMMQMSQEGRMSSDSESGHSPSPKRGFEVTNRPSRTRKASLLAQLDISSDRLREIDWLQRRRSLNAVGELDYTLTQVRREQLSTPATTDALVAAAASLPPQHQLEYPSGPVMVIHLVVQAAFLGISILTLVYLWSRAPKAAFAIFLAWIIIFYATMIIFASHLRPNRSILSALCSRLRSSPPQNPTATQITPPAASSEAPSGPYVHRPSHRLTTPADEASLSQGGPRSARTDELEDDADDDTRQQIIEEEMGRRDVSIITIPKRKLWIANP
ncbi:hypothetical protein H0H87_009039 [Tephrocybe sp. NHM501043]|nr:hypothetical protein H0H87_009039 [Tephrocybe sp. NHM501043]